jgi:hypothetical protein
VAEISGAVAKNRMRIRRGNCIRSAVLGQVDYNSVIAPTGSARYMHTVSRGRDIQRWSPGGHLLPGPYAESFKVSPPGCRVSLSVPSFSFTLAAFFPKLPLGYRSLHLCCLT